MDQLHCVPNLPAQHASALAGAVHKIHLNVSRGSDKLLTGDGWIKPNIWNTKC